MSIRNLCAVFLLAGSVCVAVGAEEKAAVFTPETVKTIEAAGAKVTEVEPGKIRVVAGEKPITAPLVNFFGIKPLSLVTATLNASGKGKYGVHFSVYNETKTLIGGDFMVLSPGDKMTPQKAVFRLHKKYGSAIPSKETLSLSLSPNAEVTFSDFKAEVNNDPQNPTLTAKTRTDWAAATYAMLTKRAQTEKDIPVMFLGDSITMLWEYPRDHKYPGGLDSWNKYFKPMGASNYGVSGDTVENVLWRVTEGRQLECNPSLIVLMIGTNNLHQKPFNTSAEIVAGIDHLIQTIQKKLPKTKILLLGIFPRSGTYPIASINEDLEDIADARGIEFMDVSGKLLQGKKEVSKEIFRDGLHLSPAGYEIWAQAILPEIVRLTKK